MESILKETEEKKKLAGVEQMGQMQNGFDTNGVDNHQMVLVKSGGYRIDQRSLCPTFARRRTRTGLGSNSKAEIGSGPVNLVSERRFYFL